jgi:predicted acylesterase/phospholipase RssA
MNVLTLLGFGLALLTTGCLAQIETLPPSSGPPPFAASPDQDRLVGIAVSGGGSRAAVFAASALEALAEISVQGRSGPQSVLETVGYISSVSGGSLATAYYVVKKPPKSEAVLGERGLSPAYRRLFDSFKRDMQMNFQLRAAIRQVLQFRAFNPTKFAYSFADVWDSNFLDGLTFAQLYERELRGDSPRVIFNGTSYNTGRRFVLTTLPASEFDYDFVGRLLADLKSRPGRVTEEGLAIIARSLEGAKEQFLPSTFQEIGGDPSSLRLSLAVATSASFPPVVGPVTYHVTGADTYHHIGDGGLFDNLGTESLTTVFLKKISPDPGETRKGLIIVIDASFPFDAGRYELDGSTKGFEVFKDDPSRIVGIMEERANSYQAMLWHSLRVRGGVLPEFGNLRLVVLKHTDADWEGYDDLPDACRSEFPRAVTPEQIKQAVSLIPTLFKIKHDCHGALLIKAAHKVVQKHRHRIVNFIETAQKPELSPSPRGTP